MKQLKAIWRKVYIIYKYLKFIQGKGHRWRRRRRRRTSAGRHVKTQLVAAGDVRDAELLNDSEGDGALARCRRAQDDGPEGPEGRRGGGVTRGDCHHGRPRSTKLTSCDRQRRRRQPFECRGVLALSAPNWFYPRSLLLPSHGLWYAKSLKATAPRQSAVTHCDVIATRRFVTLRHVAQTRAETERRIMII